MSPRGGTPGSPPAPRQQQQQPGVAADAAVLPHLDSAARAVEDYCGNLASKLGDLLEELAELEDQGGMGHRQQPAAAAAAADASRQLDAVVRAHAACASLMHLLPSAGGEHWPIGSAQWEPPRDVPLWSLQWLHGAACELWEELCRSG